MKRRSPIRALVGLAAAGLVALLGTTANAQENLYKNERGTHVYWAGPTLNPGGQGQLLYAGYYDVRDVNGDVQHNNIQILNTNTNDDKMVWCDDKTYDTDPKGTNGEICYNPYGGILAKVRFREAIDSKEVLDFVIALSCGEVWAGAVKLNGSGVPEIRSGAPVYDASLTTNEAVAITTSPRFTGGLEFIGAAGVSDSDMSRGYIEIVGMESLHCEPDSGALSADGSDTWTRIGGQASNSLAGEVFQVRAAAGVSHAYNMDAISRFATDGESIAPLDLLGAEQPNASDCDVIDALGVGFLSPQDCVAAVSLALSKSQVIAQYDIEAGTNGGTNVVFTLPNKHLYCAGAHIANPPFQCAAAGEDVRVDIYDRIENFNTPEEPPPCTESPCPPTPPDSPERLPNEVTIVSITADGSLKNNADKAWQPGSNLTQTSGWITVDMTSDYNGNLVHQEINPESTFLGNLMNGYRGLPTIALVLQEFTNSTTAAGSTYGNTVPATTSQQIFRNDQS